MAKSILDVIDSISLWSGRIASLLIYVILLCLMYEVVSRYVFKAPTSWAHEFTAFCFGVYFMCGAAYALKTKRMIAVDILYERMSRRLRACVDLLSFIFFVLVCYTLIWFGTHEALIAWHNGERSIASSWGPLLYPVKAAIPFGTLLMFLQGLAELVRQASVVFTGHEIGGE